MGIKNKNKDITASSNRMIWHRYGNSTDILVLNINTHSYGYKNSQLVPVLISRGSLTRDIRLTE